MIGNMIKKARMAMKISQKKLAEILNVSQQTVGSWEVNRTEPSTDMLKKIAECLDVSVNYLLMSEDKKERPVEKIDEPEKSPRRIYLEEQLKGVNFALLKETSDDDPDELTDDQLEEIVGLIHYVKSKKEFRPKFMDWKDPK